MPLCYRSRLAGLVRLLVEEATYAHLLSQSSLTICNATEAEMASLLSYGVGGAEAIEMKITRLIEPLLMQWRIAWYPDHCSQAIAVRYQAIPKSLSLALSHEFFCMCRSQEQAALYNGRSYLSGNEVF